MTEPEKPSAPSPASTSDHGETPPDLHGRLVELERHRDERKASEQDPLLAFGMAFSLLGGELVQELAKSTPFRWSFVGVALIVSLIISRRKRGA